MKYTLEQLSNLDIFFYYDTNTNDVDMEMECDLMSGFIQPKRSLFYDREDGAGVWGKENHPSGVLFSILTKYDIVRWIGNRNNSVSDGSNNTIDRRIAISQDSINIMQRIGEADIEVNYIPFYDFKKPGKVSLPIGGQNG